MSLNASDDALASSSPRAPQRRPGLRRAALALALLLGLQPVTTDLYLPALPTLTTELNASLTAAQLTMAALLLAFGIGQLVWGPLADRLGRKPVLLMGLALHVAASAGGALAGGIGALVVWRVLQGLGLAAAVVCARAVVRDLYEPRQGAQVMAMGLTGLGFIALACPLAGGALASGQGWRASIAGVGLFGAAVALFVALAWPETLARRNLQATRLAPMFATWGRIARHPRFVAWAALVACTYGGLFVVLAGSSFVLIGHLGLTPAQYGLALASSSGAYIVGTLVCQRWIPRLGLAGTVRRAGWFTVAGVIACLASSMLASPTVWTVMPPIWLYMFAHGSHQPCGQTGAVGPFPREAGAASALAGFILAVLAFVIGLWLGQALRGGVAPFLRGVAFFGTLTVLLAWTLVQRAERGATLGAPLVAPPDSA